MVSGRLVISDWLVTFFEVLASDRLVASFDFSIG